MEKEKKIKIKNLKLKNNLMIIIISITLIFSYYTLYKTDKLIKQYNKIETVSNNNEGLYNQYTLKKIENK